MTEEHVDPSPTDDAGGVSVQVDRLLAAYDRAAAAVDRYRAYVERRLAADFARRTYEDDATGAMQRDVGLRRLGAEMSHAERAHSDMALVRVACGSPQEAVRDIGHALVLSLRSYDIVIRYDATELVVALPGATVTQAQDRITRVLSSVRTPAVADVAYGLTDVRPGDSVDDAIRRAEPASLGGAAAR